MIDINHAQEVLAQRRATLANVGGRQALADLLLAPPEELAGCPVHLVLRACPYIGDAKVRELCVTTRTWPFDTLGQIGRHKREALAHRVML